MRRCGAAKRGPRGANAAGRAPCESGRGIEPAPACCSQLPPNRIGARALVGGGEIDRREAARLLARPTWSPRVLLRSLAGCLAYGL